ncbi:MAG TPA: branched-chain amino acid transaminase, partial [Patescibacteria group bacterium]|nr:branched-chain amino acid transaminase [Patescibacteria group bacterium]
MKKRIMYLDGKFVTEEKAVVPVTAHALHYGTGVFEGIRAYYSQKDKALYVFRLEDHFKRFLDSCKILCIDLGLSAEELSQLTIELIKKNFSETDMYIRPLAFKSDPAVGNFNLKTLKDSLAIYTVAMGRMIEKNGINATISSWTRVSDNSIPPRAKITGAYANTSLAKTESIAGGYDEALLMDNRGHVVEGSAENVFLVKNGVVITPPVSDDILVGITRDTMMRLISDQLHLPLVERSIDRSEVYQADELFLVGTGAEVTPVIKVDGRNIGDG